MIINKSKEDFRYKDIDLSFSFNPIRKDVLPIKDVEAVKRSVKHLILVSLFERRLNPWAGSLVYTQLFENFTPQTTAIIRKLIVNVLKIYEPRVTVQQVIVKPSEDEHFLEVTIQFTINNIEGSQFLSFNLERLR